MTRWYDEHKTEKQRRVSIPEMRDHVLSIKEEYRIPMFFDKGSPAAWTDSSSEGGQVRYIRTLNVTNSAAYAIALHEIGHILGPDQDRESNYGKLYSESGAWMWAEVKALTWTAPMVRIRRKALRSYLAAAWKDEEVIDLYDLDLEEACPPWDHKLWHMAGFSYNAYLAYINGRLPLKALL